MFGHETKVGFRVLVDLGMEQEIKADIPHDLARSDSATETPHCHDKGDLCASTLNRPYSGEIEGLGVVCPVSHHAVCFQWALPRNRLPSVPRGEPSSRS